MNSEAVSDRSSKDKSRRDRWPIGLAALAALLVLWRLTEVTHLEKRRNDGRCVAAMAALAALSLEASFPQARGENSVPVAGTRLAQPPDGADKILSHPQFEWEGVDMMPERVPEWHIQIARDDAFQDLLRAQKRHRF